MPSQGPDPVAPGSEPPTLDRATLCQESQHRLWGHPTAQRETFSVCPKSCSSVKHHPHLLRGAAEKGCWLGGLPGEMGCQLAWAGLCFGGARLASPPPALGQPDQSTQGRAWAEEAAKRGAGSCLLPSVRSAWLGGAQLAKVSHPLEGLKKRQTHAAFQQAHGASKPELGTLPRML